MQKVQRKTCPANYGTVKCRMCDRIQTPFTFTRIDYFGRIDVKQDRSTVNIYDYILTCFVTRVFYLEVVSSLDAYSFIKAYRRFVAGRGHFFSDNGRCFAAGERELREALTKMNQHTIEGAFHTQGCEWHFTPSLAFNLEMYGKDQPEQ